MILFFVLLYVDGTDIWKGESLPKMFSWFFCNELNGHPTGICSKDEIISKFWQKNLLHCSIKNFTARGLKLTFNFIFSWGCSISQKQLAACLLPFSCWCLLSKRERERETQHHCKAPPLGYQVGIEKFLLSDLLLISPKKLLNVQPQGLNNAQFDHMQKSQGV